MLGISHTWLNWNLCFASTGWWWIIAHTHTHFFNTLGEKFWAGFNGFLKFYFSSFPPHSPFHERWWVHTYMHTELLTDTWRCKEEIPGRWWCEEKPTFVTLLDKAPKPLITEKESEKVASRCWAVLDFYEEPPVSVVLRASPTVLCMWSCTVKLDEENRTYAGLAQEIGFVST